MKLKDYSLDQEDLEQYSLKNFDLKAFQLAQAQPDPDPIPAPYVPAPVARAPDPLPVNAWSPAPEPPAVEQSFIPAPNPVQTELSPPALDPVEIHFGAHFDLQQPLYIASSPSDSWKMPRWVIMTVGLFFGSAVVLTIATCVVLLRDPNAKPAPPEPLAVATAPIATTPPAPAHVSPSAPPVSQGHLADPAVRRPGPAVANLMHDGSALPPRVVVSRHPGVVRRPIYGSRRVVARSTSSSVEPQETETVSRRPPQDALDKLLSESSL